MNPLQARPGYRNVVKAVLDRTDARDGRLPGRLTLSDLSESESEDIIAALEVNHFTREGSGRFVIHVDRICRDAHGSNPERMKRKWYGLLNREPRRLPSEHAARVEELKERLTKLPHGNAREEILQDLEGGAGWITGVLGREGVEEAAHQAGLFVRTLAALPLDEPTRLRRLSTSLHKDTKCLDPGTETYRRITDYLLDRVPASQWEDPELKTREKRRRILEQHHVFRDFTSVRALIYGTLTFRYSDEIEDHVRENANRGLATVLTLDELRTCEIADPLPSFILSIENETSFNEIADRIGEEVLLVFSEGEPNSAVRWILSDERLGEVPKFHWGDIDASGFRILHGLQQRCEIQPLLMSANTVHRYGGRLTPLPTDKADEIQAMLDGEVSAGKAASLTACLEQEGWLEQEAIPIQAVVQRIEEKCLADS